MGCKTCFVDANEKHILLKNESVIFPGKKLLVHINAHTKLQNEDAVNQQPYMQWHF